jgi:hypothetical protein
MNQKRVPSKELIAAARLRPNGWVYQVEGNFGPDEPVPSEAIAGAWSVDGKGEIVGDFIPNPNHVPKQKPRSTDED